MKKEFAEQKGVDGCEDVHDLMKYDKTAYGQVLHKMRVKPGTLLSDKEQELCAQFGFLEKFIIGRITESTTIRLPMVPMLV